MDAVIEMELCIIHARDSLAPWPTRQTPLSPGGDCPEVGSTPKRGESWAGGGHLKPKPSALAGFLTASPSLALDRRVREPAHGGRVHPAEVPGHPGEHGLEQSEPVPEDRRGDHRGAAHLAPPGVSVTLLCLLPGPSSPALCPPSAAPVFPDAGPLVTHHLFPTTHCQNSSHNSELVMSRSYLTPSVTLFTS